MSSNGAERPARGIGVGMARNTEESTAAGIYGVIVSAAVMVASDAESAVALDLAVLVTLLIYWGAERYARLIAERIHLGHRLTFAQTRRQLTHGWAFVTASFLPLVVLSVVRLLGAGMDTAVIAALGCSTLLLGLAGWEMGRLGHLTLLERIAATAVGGLFGVVLIFLKTTLH